MTAKNKIRKILSKVFYEKRLNKSALKEKTGYSVTTVFNAVEELKDEKLLNEETKINSFGGKPSIFLSINPLAKIGVISKNGENYFYSEKSLLSDETFSERLSKELLYEKGKEENVKVLGIFEENENTPLSFYRLFDKPLLCCGNKWILKALTFRYLIAKNTENILILLFEKKSCFLLGEKVEKLDIFFLFEDITNLIRPENSHKKEDILKLILSFVKLIESLLKPGYILWDLQKKSFEDFEDRIFEKILFGEDIEEEVFSLPLHFLLYHNPRE